MATIEAYVVTFNCGRKLIKPAVFAPYLLSAASSTPDLLVVCLQEIAPLGIAFLGGSFLTPYFNAFASAVQLAQTGYINVINRNVGLTAIMIFAKEELASDIAWIETAGTGVGFAETGHKGAVGVRLKYEDTVMSFVSAHLAPAEDALERRNADFKAITERLVFSAEDKSPRQDERDEDAPLLQGTQVGKGSDLMYSTSHLIFAGDLNYRTSGLSPGKEDAASFPQPAKDTTDPKHWSHLLKHDQLTEEVKADRTLQGLQEQSIDFPPTYKYRSEKDVTRDEEGSWSWATHRWPSWCDRIFYSPTSLKPQAYQALPLFGTSDHRPVALSLTIPLGPVEEQVAPYKIDPSWKSRREAARVKELAVGTAAYLTWTNEGIAILLASVVGICGAGFILRSLLA